MRFKDKVSRVALRVSLIAMVVLSIILSAVIWGSDARFSRIEETSNQTQTKDLGQRSLRDIYLPTQTFYFKNIMAIHGERERHPYAGWEKASPIYRQKGNPQTGDNLQFLDSQAGKRLISAPRRLLRRYDLRVFRGGWKVPPIWENQQKYGLASHL